MTDEDLTLLSEVAAFLDCWYFDVVGDECQATADQLLAKVNSAIIQNMDVPSGPRWPAPTELNCYSCDRPYDWGPDLVVSDADWARIKPPEGSSQVMCPNCMNDAFEALGVAAGSVEAAFTSGPFAQPNWRKP